MPLSLNPGQQQAWEAVLASAEQPDLAIFKQALRAARSVLSHTMALTVEQRAELWRRVLVHPDVAWHRAALKAQPMDVRGGMMASTPLNVWNRPRWLNELWSLLIPDRVVHALWRADAPDHLPAVERLRPLDKRAKRFTQEWANGLLLQAIKDQDVARMRTVWAWAEPTDEHWREVVLHATAPMLAWLSELHVRHGGERFGGEFKASDAAAIPLRHLAVEACRLNGESAQRLFEWCVPLLRRHHKQSAYLSLFETWISASLGGGTVNEGWLDLLERHMPDMLSAKVMAKLCQRDQQARLARWLPGRAPPLAQVIADLVATLPTSPTLSSSRWKIVDQVGEVWPTPEDLEPWVKAHSEQLPRSMARFRTALAGQAPPPTPRSRPRQRA